MTSSAARQKIIRKKRLQPAIVVLCILLSPSLGKASEKRRLTWEDVYGRNRLSVTDPAPTNFEWLDDSTLLEYESMWVATDAITGRQQPWYDKRKLRQRLIDHGVTGELAEQIAEGDWTLYSTKSRICVLRDEATLIRAGLDADRIQVVSGIPADAQLLTLSPMGNACAFTSDDDLWCADFERQQVRRLTDHQHDGIRNGHADWVYYEEVLHRSRKAFQFSPDGTHLLFQQFDDRLVNEFTLVDDSGPQQTLDVQRYPLVDMNNPAVKLGIARIDDGAVRWLRSTSPNPTHLITGFGWYPDSKRVYWYLQDRAQTRLDFLQSDAASGETLRLFRETTEAWVIAPPAPQFLDDGSMLLLSERTGWRHVDRISSDGQRRRGITSGNWDVTKLLAVSADQTQIILTGRRDSPTADQIYSVGLADRSIRRISNAYGHHTVSSSPHGGSLVAGWSDLQTQKSVAVIDRSGRTHRVLHRPSVPSEWNDLERGRVELTTVTLADGAQGHAVIVYPPDFDTSMKYPVWLKVYGGPRFSRIRNEWRSRLNDQLLAAHGIVVVRFDPRTSGGFGARGAWKAWHQLGVEETRDVEAVCDWLFQRSWADSRRIGMSGHSYGGYLTAYVMTHSKRIAAGIAGAPVTDWDHYDSIYTERYMGTRSNNRKGYQISSVTEAAADLHGKLLLIHGLRDRNVHASHTVRFVRMLQQANQPFELMLYPRSRHSIHNRSYNRQTFDFIVDAMQVARQD